MEKQPVASVCAISLTHKSPPRVLTVSACPPDPLSPVYFPSESGCKQFGRSRRGKYLSVNMRSGRDLGCTHARCVFSSDGFSLGGGGRE